MVRTPLTDELIEDWLIRHDRPGHFASIARQGVSFGMKKDGTVTVSVRSYPPPRENWWHAVSDPRIPSEQRHDEALNRAWALKKAFGFGGVVDQHGHVYWRSGGSKVEEMVRYLAYDHHCGDHVLDRDDAYAEAIPLYKIILKLDACLDLPMNERHAAFLAGPRLPKRRRLTRENRMHPRWRKATRHDHEFDPDGLKWASYLAHNYRRATKADRELREEMGLTSNYFFTGGWSPEDFERATDPAHPDYVRNESRLNDEVRRIKVNRIARLSGRLSRLQAEDAPQHLLDEASTALAFEQEQQAHEQSFGSRMAERQRASSGDSLDILDAVV